jgi:hypothetical protein
MTSRLNNPDMFITDFVASMLIKLPLIKVKI